MEITLLYGRVQQKTTQNIGNWKNNDMMFGEFKTNERRNKPWSKLTKDSVHSWLMHKRK